MSDYTPTTYDDTRAACASFHLLCHAVGYTEYSDRLQEDFDALRRTTETNVRPASDNPTYREALGELSANLLYSLAAMATTCANELIANVTALRHDAYIDQAAPAEYLDVFNKCLAEHIDKGSYGRCDACSTSGTVHPEPSYVSLNYYLWVDGPIDDGVASP